MDPRSFTPTTDGLWLRRKREGNGLRQSDVAELLHIHPGRICEIERGQKTLGPAVREVLERYFDTLETGTRIRHRGFALHGQGGAAIRQDHPTSNEACKGKEN